MKNGGKDNSFGHKRGGFNASEQGRYIDIHCHCLPDIDDGPVTMSDSLALCRALVSDGIGTVIATPHQLGRFSNSNNVAKIRERVSQLNKELENNGINLTVMAGAEVRVDERIFRLVITDEILTLADGGRYILLELPHEVFIDIEPLLEQLCSLGICAVISHPEKHPILARESKVLAKWLNHSAYLQLTAGCLLGDFGHTSEKTAWRFLSSGLASLVATDSHDLSVRRPRMRAVFRRICRKFGKDIAQRVCIENPSRILKGREIRTVYPISTGKRIYESGIR